MISMIKIHLKNGNKEEDIYLLEDYYIKRVEHMINQWNKLFGNKIYISSESLTNKPNETLSNISNFLSLETPITPRYNIYSDTGRGGVGDPSKNIKSGVILKETIEDKYSKELLQNLNMDKINEVYIQALNIFTKDNGNYSSANY